MEMSLTQVVGEKIFDCSRFAGESDIIAGCKKRDPKAQHMLYSMYASKMLGICKRYACDTEIAQDLLQEGFIKVFAKIGTYKGEGSFAGWIRKIFVNTSLEYLRKNSCMKFYIPVDECINLEDDFNVSALSKLNTDDLLACIECLPVGYRTIFNLYAIEGYSHTEIAEILNIKESTSQSQLMRAKRILQKNVQLLIGKEYARQG